MDLRLIDDSQKNQFNSLATHVIQSWEWGEFRKSFGIPLLRYGLFKDKKLVTAFQITFHQIPLTKKFVGYLPKGPFPDEDFTKALKQIGQQQNCTFIKIEPNILKEQLQIENLKLPKSYHFSPKPLFTKNNFILDLTQSEEELLKNMHPKTRYNIRVAQKHQVQVEERTDDEAFEIFLELYFETTARQKYYGHNPLYHKKAWENFRKHNMARILIASYKNTPLTAWMLYNFKDTLYYPYGGSSVEYKEVMSNNLIAWEAIKLGKALKLKTFDMWGALGENPDPKDPWIGFHRFKKGYGGKLVEYIGTYDLVFNPVLYKLFNSVNSATALKVLLLKILKK